VPECVSDPPGLELQPVAGNFYASGASIGFSRRTLLWGGSDSNQPAKQPSYFTCKSASLYRIPVRSKIYWIVAPCLISYSPEINWRIAPNIRVFHYSPRQMNVTWDTKRLTGLHRLPAALQCGRSCRSSKALMHSSIYVRFPNLTAVKVSVFVVWVVTAWRWRLYVSPKLCYLPTSPHYVTTQRSNIEKSTYRIFFLILTKIRTSYAKNHKYIFFQRLFKMSNFI
jgi:hypothetical protein